MKWTVYKFYGDSHFINHQNRFNIEIQTGDIWADRGDGTFQLGDLTMSKKMPHSVTSNSGILIELEDFEYAKFLAKTVNLKYGIQLQEIGLAENEHIAHTVTGLPFRMKTF